jgi:tetratricopeptide (TPR) repeat protein
MGTMAVDWTPLHAVFAASLVAGAIAFWRVYGAFRKRAPEPEASPLDRRELLRRREVLVQQLREVPDTDAERTPEQLARERLGVELESVLRQLDRDSASRARARQGRAAGRSTGGSVSASNPMWRGFLWGTVSTAAAGLLLFLGYPFLHSKERGGSVLARTAVAGAAGSSHGASTPSTAAREAQLKTAVSRNPEDMQARLELARLSLIKEDWQAAFDQTREVLKRSPEDARGLTYLGVIRFNTDQPDVAIALFQQAIAKKPDLLEPYLQLAFAYFRLDREPEAEGTLAIASRRFPDKAAMVSGLLAKWRRQAGEQAAASAKPGAGAPTNR